MELDRKGGKNKRCSGCCTRIQGTNIYGEAYKDT